MVDGPDGTIAHAELQLGAGRVMLGSEREDDDRPFGSHADQGWVYVAVDDPDAHCERARAVGAEDRDGADRHRLRLTGLLGPRPEGNLWSFGTYLPGAEG